MRVSTHRNSTIIVMREDTHHGVSCILLWFVSVSKII